MVKEEVRDMEYLFYGVGYVVGCIFMIVYLRLKLDGYYVWRVVIIWVGYSDGLWFLVLKMNWDVVEMFNCELNCGEWWYCKVYEVCNVWWREEKG